LGADGPWIHIQSFWLAFTAIWLAPVENPPSTRTFVAMLVCGRAYDPGEHIVHVVVGFLSWSY
jgi:hypothetical protein